MNLSAKDIYQEDNVFTLYPTSATQVISEKHWYLESNADELGGINWQSGKKKEHT